MPQLDWTRVAHQGALLSWLGRDLQQLRIKSAFTKTRVSSPSHLFPKVVAEVIFYYRPEVKENKEGADTEKAAEHSPEPEELVKEKVIAAHSCSPAC